MKLGILADIHEQDDELRKSIEVRPLRLVRYNNE